MKGSLQCPPYPVLRSTATVAGEERHPEPDRPRSRMRHSRRCTGGPTMPGSPRAALAGDRDGKRFRCAASRCRPASVIRLDVRLRGTPLSVARHARRARPHLQSLARHSPARPLGSRREHRPGTARRPGRRIDADGRRPCLAPASRT
jgi:hypothetical protein